MSTRWIVLLPDNQNRQHEIVVTAGSPNEAIGCAIADIQHTHPRFRTSTEEGAMAKIMPVSSPEECHMIELSAFGEWLASLDESAVAAERVTKVRISREISW